MGYEALVAFCEQSGICAERAEELRSWAAVNPAAAQSIARQAVALREALHGLLRRSPTGRPRRPRT